MKEINKSIKCPNCYFEYSGKFCSNCGQKTIEGRLFFKSLFLDFINTTFLIDAPIIRTLKELLICPGDFFRNYLNGKRKSYLQPIQFFIFLLSVYLIILNWIGVLEITNQEFIKPDLESVQSQNINKLIPKLKGVPNFFKRNLNIFYFLLPPILAFFYRKFFKDLKLNYSESLIYSFYLLGMVLFISLFLMPLSLININIYFSVKFSILFCYFSYAFMQYAKSKKVSHFFKSVLVVGLSYFFYMFTLLIFTISHFLLKQL